jgi:hypothetical protein
MAMAVAGSMKLAEMREITLTGSGRIRRLLLRQLMDSGSWTAASRGRVQLIKQGRHHGGGDEGLDRAGC